MEITPDKLRAVLVTDCGSTTTKALLFEKTDDGWRHTFRGEAPTTVEEPVANVTVGARNAFQEVEELSGRTILKDTVSAGASPFVDYSGSKGIDLYLSTSSAGGGLQMMVAGVVRHMTAESAERAALGAGAIVMDVICADDGREEHERIERIRHIRPDIVLLTGGTDGGSRTHVIEMAEALVAAAPKPRFGDTLTLPVIYAGNADAAEEVSSILDSIAELTVVPNVRPRLEEEQLGPAREAIHEFFLSHVMSHSPGYSTLLSWTPRPVMPTPAAVGDMVQSYAASADLQVLCVDIGGATTDVFSVFRDADGKQVFNRTVSANLGMSYSVANVLVEAGADNIMRWLPYEISAGEVRDRLRNKMIRPTSIPQVSEDLWLEHAVCREALRLSLLHHRELATGLSGVQRQRGIADIFSQKAGRSELVNMLELDLVIGSGGVLSHAPAREHAALMMIDGFGVAGLTQLAVDSIFMMPHLGVFAEVHPEAAHEIFQRDCLVHVGHCIAPVYRRAVKPEELLADVVFNGEQVGSVSVGQLHRVSLAQGSEGSLTITPQKGDVDVGAGEGEPLTQHVVIGECGLFLDGRNRPLEVMQSARQHEQQRRMLEACGIL